MNYYRATLQYDGTQYAGFQWQEGVETVQRAVNLALAALVPGKITTSAASRTDTGVHALHQIVRICSERPLDLKYFQSSFNQSLPHDICCIAIEPCAGNFIPSASASSKEYRYFFTNHIPRDDQTFSVSFIANIANPLDIELMQRCAALIVGTHDFCNFCSTGSNVKSTIRTIFHCELSEIDPSDLFKDQQLFTVAPNFNSCYQLRIVGNGFLKQMVRHLMRGLWMVGSGKISPEQFQTYLNGPEVHKQLWKVAPANGLFLYQIFEK